MTPEVERYERKLGDKKARGEIRNAVRQTMVDGGISPAQIKKAADEMALSAAAAAVKSVTSGVPFEVLVRRLVKEELNKILVGMGGGDLPALVKKLLSDAIAAEAKKFVINNLAIRIKEGGDWS